MAEQNYAHHTRLVPGFHGVLAALILLTFFGSLVNLWRSLGDHHGLYSASLIVVLSVIAVLFFYFTRTFALKAQDRVIRAEENLRHLVLTGKLVDPRVTIQQIIALRFAPDAEFPGLVQKAAGDGLSPDAIKREVKNWRADTYRV
jgi:hypothetical protein